VTKKLIDLSFCGDFFFKFLELGLRFQQLKLDMST